MTFWEALIEFLCVLPRNRLASLYGDRVPSIRGERATPIDGDTRQAMGRSGEHHLPCETVLQKHIVASQSYLIKLGVRGLD
jgi:hypothetical protein